MRTRRTRLAACAAAVVLGAGVIAGCGGDDEEPTATTVTEQVTVTAGTEAVPDDTATESVPEVIPGGAPESGDDGGTSGNRPSDEELQQAIDAYVQFFGFTEDQARCLIEASLELSESVDPNDPSSILGSDAFELLQRCDIDPADLASQFGGTP